MFDQSRYDKTLSYDLNKRRREEVVRGFYEKAVQQDKSDAHYNRMLTKTIKPAEIRMSMEELRMRILYDEELKRKRVRALFDSEKQQFDQLYKQQQAHNASQDVQLARLEEKAAAIREQKLQKSTVFNESAYSRQWEQNCDELRGVDAQIQARACRLQWELQNLYKKRIQEYEEARERRIDSIVVNDYKQFLVDQQRAHELRLKKMQQTHAELDAQLTEQQKVRASEREAQLLQDAHEKELRDFGAEIERLATDIQLQKNYFNRAELECQMAVYQATSEAHRQTELFDGQELIKQIREEQKQQALEKYQNMVREYELELACRALEEQRKSVVQAEQKAVDAYFVSSVNARDKQLALKEENALKSRKQRDLQCWQENQAADERRREMQEQNKEDKRAELTAAYADIELMRKEKAEALQRQMKEQREYLAYLYMQDDVKKGKTQTLKQEDLDYAKSQRDALMHDFQEIERRLGDYKQRIEELDSVKFVDDKRPKLQQRHWYNV